MPDILLNVDLQNQNEKTMPIDDVMDGLRLLISPKYHYYFSFQPYLEALRRQVTNGCHGSQSAILPVVEEYTNAISESKMKFDEIKVKKEFRALVNMAVPSMLFGESLSFVSPPFMNEILVVSDSLNQILTDEDWAIVVDPKLFSLFQNSAKVDLNIFILNKLYNLDIKDQHKQILHLRNKKKKLDRKYQVQIQTDFVDVKVNGEIPKLSKSELNNLMNNMDDDALWLETFPTDLLEIYGFVLGTWVDITEIESLSSIKHYLSKINVEVKNEQLMSELGVYVQSYLGQQNIQFGAIVLNKNNPQRKARFSLTGLSGEELINSYLNNQEYTGLYNNVFEDRILQTCDVLDSACSKDFVLNFTKKKNLKSIVIFPILDEQQEVVSILEVGSEKEHAFNSMSIERLQKVVDLFSQAYGNIEHALQAKIDKIIQQNYTSIHPSVEWKFQQISADYFRNKKAGKDPDLSPVVFNDLIPLYGQSDIVGSSTLRNTSILGDLVENLESLQTLLNIWHQRKPLLVLDQFRIRVNSTLERIKTDYTSKDESIIVEMLTKEIHPFLKSLATRYVDLPKPPYQKYLQCLDPEFNIVYKRRKDFEQSVTKLNHGISEFIEESDNQMQDVIPHYFEKYKTDGVEYNIYLGESIVEDSQFDDFYIKEFRMWQLTNMCKVAKYVNEISSTLPMPLTTAQLIFVYNTSLSIRFRMDEKRFDVDGSYNVRYEILKKRIDKAIILNTNERLTVEGKIAIVYLSEVDKAEYLDYVKYLVDKNLIEDEVEDLELEKMQGADGLKALRVTVKL